jgi:hypothetical protein
MPQANSPHGGSFNKWIAEGFGSSQDEWGEVASAGTACYINGSVAVQ